jgi:pre-mRNA-splicing factor SYF1
VWDSVIEAVTDIRDGEVGKHILRRYLKLSPTFMEDYVDYLRSIGDWRSASQALVGIVNDDRFVSTKGKSAYEFCMDLCQMVSMHPEECVDVDGNAAIRHCIGRYTDEVGNLWNYLAEYYIRQGLFEKGRDVFEEALEKVASARDFGIIYSAYLKFEEELLTLAMEEGEEDQEALLQQDREDAEASYLDNLLDLAQKDRIE